MKYRNTARIETRKAAYATAVPGVSLHVCRHVEYGNSEFSVSLQADATGETAGHACVAGSAVRDVFILAPAAFSDMHASLVLAGNLYVLAYDDGMQLAADFQLPTRLPAWAKDRAMAARLRGLASRVPALTPASAALPGEDAADDDVLAGAAKDLLGIQ